MKVTKRQLRRIIREFSNRSYDMGLRDAESGQEPDQERYDNDPDYADGYDSYDPYDHLEEAEGSTKKYDDDSALKGGQSKLPDGLQKSIIDKTVEDREEHDEERKEKNEGTDLGNMPDSWRQILGNCLGKETIKEEKNRPLHEQPISGEQAEQMQRDVFWHGSMGRGPCRLHRQSHLRLEHCSRHRPTRPRSTCHSW